MDKTKSPGIALEQVHLLECSVGEVDPDAKLAFSLGITRFRRTLLSDGKLLMVVVSFDLMKGVEKPPCQLNCTFTATYSRSPDSNMTWEEFKDHLAVAHLIPYVREFISNMTVRLPLATLLLPPLNAQALVKEYQQLMLTESKSQKEAADVRIEKPAGIIQPPSS